MSVARHREALEPEPSLIQMAVPMSGARPSNASHACVPANGRRPSLAVCVRPDGEVPVVGQDAGGQDADPVPLVRLIMTRWNASKSASLPKRCILPTDRFSTWYTCPPGAFRLLLAWVKEYQGAVAAVSTSCVPVSVPEDTKERWPPSILAASLFPSRPLVPKHKLIKIQKNIRAARRGRRHRAQRVIH